MPNVPHLLKRGRPLPLDQQQPKAIWFYGGYRDFEEIVEKRFGLKVTHPETAHTASIVEIPTLDEFYAVRRLFEDELRHPGTITDEWQDWIVEDPAEN